MGRSTPSSIINKLQDDREAAKASAAPRYPTRVTKSDRNTAAIGRSVAPAEYTLAPPPVVSPNQHASGAHACAHAHSTVAWFRSKRSTSSTTTHPNAAPEAQCAARAFSLASAAANPLSY
eukprot:1175631-Prorocentrum_minimum.AAC.1